MIGHHARFRENDDLPPWQGPATKKKSARQWPQSKVGAWSKVNILFLFAIFLIKATET